jgi:CysZ protein
MLTAARLALADVFSSQLRAAMFKSLALTLILLFALWLALEVLLARVIDIEAYPWLDLTLSVLVGFGLLVGLAFLVAPVAALFAGLFTDQIVGAIEAQHYSFDPPGRELPASEALRETFVFAGSIIVVNLIAFALLLVAGVGAIAFLVGNGYLLGREYFEAIARRYLSHDGTRTVRHANRMKLFVAGLVIAAIAAVPIVNLITPLFATAFMLHLYKRTIRPVPPEWLDFDTGEAR